MRQFFLSVILILSGLALFAQSEAVSPTYSFQIKKKIEPPILDFVPGSVLFKDADGNNAINANEACAIEFKLRNTGTGDGLNLRAKLTATRNRKRHLFCRKREHRKFTERKYQIIQCESKRRHEYPQRGG